ncbi:MAG TPA: hypothetical protein DD979_09190 [Gammaproteobacteria bacterium]|nr:hypothetical protein [Gammaproteobacteria bacterium]
MAAACSDIVKSVSDQNPAGSGDTYKLQVVAETGGRIEGVGAPCRDACSTTLDMAAEVVLSAIPDNGYEFVGWQGDCAAVASDQCQLMLDSDKNVTAEFAPQDAISDTQQPVVSLIAPTLTTVSHDTATIDVIVAAEDNDVIQGVRWVCTQGCTGDGDAIKSAADDTRWHIDALALSVGLNEVTVTATDRANNNADIVVTLTRQRDIIVSGYQSPIGIPDPGLEWAEGLHPIETQAPTDIDWQANNTYYIDYTLGDDRNGEGAPDAPRKTLPENVPAGAYIELHGTFPENTKLERTPRNGLITFDCTAADPCWIRGESATNRPKILGTFDLQDAHYVFVEHLDFDGGTGGAISVSGDSHHVAIRHSRFVNRQQPSGAATAISIRPGQGDAIDNIVVFANHFENLGDWTVTEDIDFHGVGPSLWGRDASSELSQVWILENY